MSKIEEIKKQIQTAIEAVKDFDEPYRTKAFEVILSKFMERIPVEKGVKRVRRKTQALPLKEKIEEFAEATNLSVDQLENVFEFDEQGLRFIAPLTGSIPERQVSFVQCVLIGLEYVYGKKSISATEFAKIFDDYGLSKKNIGRSLGRHRPLFRMFGRKKSTKYRLTDVGKTSAIELVHTLATSET